MPHRLGSSVLAHGEHPLSSGGLVGILGLRMLVVHGRFLGSEDALMMHPAIQRCRLTY